MKILFTGGGTGGHFYPIIAVAEEVRKIADEQKYVEPQLYYMATDPYDERMLFENRIGFIPVQAGKIRRYFSIKNFFDIFKTINGIIKAIIRLYVTFPDVVFGKGGYSSFPALVAARILGIPVVIHESDSLPGRVNLWAGKFARRIALSYPEAAKYFPKDRTAVTGNPIRRNLLQAMNVGAFEFLQLEPDIPVIVVVGGSQGSSRINDTVLSILPTALQDYQIIHQVGKENYDDCQKRSMTILANHTHRDRYHIYSYLNDDAQKMAAGAATLYVSRAGSTIFEIANWGVPSIIVPIPEPISHDQKTNAFTYARSGACSVIEEENLSPGILLAEINRLVANDKLRSDMATKAKQFSRPDAARLIAQELINIALQHEK